MKPGAWLVASLLLVEAAASAAQPSAARQQELLSLLKQDCGACHGLSLRGGLGPSLLPEAVADKPADFLAATILYGRPGTPMPPWNPFVTPQEADWLARKIREGVQ